MALAVTGCPGPDHVSPPTTTAGPFASTTNPSSPPDSASGSCPAQDGNYSGDAQHPIEFTIANCQITGLHGTTTQNCASGNATESQQHEYSDADTIAVGQDGTFSDDYKYSVGNGEATLHVEGTVNGDGTATGFASEVGVVCGAGLTGWAAALPGVTVPAVPASPSTTLAACSPEPCETKDGITVSVQSVSAATVTDGSSAAGVDVAFTVVNDSSAPITLANVRDNFILRLGDGTVIEHSGSPFTDASGQQIQCLVGSVDVPPNSQTSQHLCFGISAAQVNQAATFSWLLVSPASFDIPIDNLP